MTTLQEMSEQSLTPDSLVLMPDLPIPPPVFIISNPATEEEDDPGWSTSETFSSH